jgi:Crinkler effector protein N-terminal domain
MSLGDDDLLLFCVIKGETESFSIDAERSSGCNPKYTVGNLKEKIQEERKNDSLAGVGAHSLLLLKGACYRRVAISDYMAYFCPFSLKIPIPSM